MKRLQPAIGLAVLLVVTAIALRGHVPGVEPPPAVRPAPPSGNDPLALTVVVLLLVASVAVVALAVVARWRRRGAAPAAVAARPQWLRDDTPYSWRRIALVLSIAVIGWLIFVMVLSRFGGGDVAEPSAIRPPGATPTTGAANPSAKPAPPISPPADDGNLFGYLYGATAVFLLVLAAGTIVATRTRRRPPSVPPGGHGDDDEAAGDAATPLARAAEVGLAEVEDPSREPRKAIIACYAAMERELATVPDAMPQDFDTATEVLARAVDHHALGPGTATQLVELFDEARFSPHVMGEGHRDVAVQVLQRVLGELRSRT